MYNEEKKLITDIQRKKDLDRNLPLFAEVAQRADFEYACHKFTLNYLTLLDMNMEGDVPEDTYIAECQTVIEKLLGKCILDGDGECGDEDIRLISDTRNKITHKMKIFTSYTDAFETYEYILNRKEYGFEENMTDELKKEHDGMDVKAFAEEIYRFVFADSDKVAVNSKLQSLIGQLPIRLTKNKFYDILCDTLDIYNGVEKEVLDEFIDMIESTALIKKPEGFEDEYPELYKALGLLADGRYTDMDYEEYSRLAGTLDKSVTFLNAVVTKYMLIIELVNDLYVMLIACGVKDKVSDNCRKAMKVLREALAGGSDSLEDTYLLLESVVGEQEIAGEHKLMLESAIYDITTGYAEDITRCGLEKEYKGLTTIDKLLSGSMFVDIDNIEIHGVFTVDSEYIASCKEIISSEFAELFDGKSMTYVRAVMAKLLSSIPVFFNTMDEIKEYIDNSLMRCREKSELLADYVMIKQMMEE